nr:histidinol-phosphate transaminase [Thiolinea disciformis]
MPSNLDYRSLAVKGVQKLHPYQPGKPIEELERELGVKDIIKLASNENPLGSSPKAKAAMQAALNDLELYPDGSGYQLKLAIAGKFDLLPQQITLGNGSNDLLEIVARAYLTPGRAAVFSQYAFAIYALVSQSAGADLLTAEAFPPEHVTMPYGHNVDALLKTIKDNPHTALVFISNPNNPTGTWIAREELYRFLKNVPPHVVVLLDEAYTEYVQDPAFPNGMLWLNEFPNLIVTRTFSKIYGLAGLRVGYSISSPEIADILNRVRQPFNVNSLALTAASAALEDDAFLQASVTTNEAGLKQWYAACAAHGWSYIPTVGNFITVKVEGKTGAQVYEALLREGVIVRPIGGYGLPQHLRITVGTEAQNTRCIKALDKVLKA